MEDLGAISACADALERAPFSNGGWARAVEAFAGATGSPMGQLIGWSAPDQIPLHINPFSEESLNQWYEHGGTDPAINPLVAAGLKVPCLATFTDSDVLSRDARQRHALWQSVYVRYDIPHLASTVIWRDGQDMVVVSAIRGASQGHFTTADRETIGALLPRWREAVLLDRALKGEAIHILKGALDATSVAAFVLDGFGRVVVATSKSQRLLGAGGWLKVQQGHLAARTTEGSARITAAFNECLLRRIPTRLTLTAEYGALDICVSRLPVEQSEISFGAAAIVICEDRLRIPCLTPSELEVAKALLDGHSLAEIADQRSTSIETVKSQAKAIYAKAGVHGQLELIRSAPGWRLG